MGFSELLSGYEQMLEVGLLGVGARDKQYVWTGGVYYMQHIVRAVIGSRHRDALRFRHVVWGNEANGTVIDPFVELREILGETAYVHPPAELYRRTIRRLKRTFRFRDDSARDLFLSAGVQVCFPTRPCSTAGIPYVYWIPDFQHRMRPDLLPQERIDGFEQMISTNAPGAAKIVLSSENAKQHLAQFYPEHLHKASVVSFSSIPDTSWWIYSPQQVIAKYSLPHRYFICSNQLTRHKNHVTLIEALGYAKRAGRVVPTIVFTGSTFDYRGEDYLSQVTSLASQLGVSDHVRILGLIDRSEQIALLRGSIALLQPSEFEGWSTIVEDAKSLGKPIIASDLEVHREQLETYVQHQLVSPRLHEIWGNAMVDMLSDAALASPGYDALEANRQIAESMDKCARAFITVIYEASGQKWEAKPCR
jgi:glycosyltransferase involved in cell wall biosynthesis